MSLECKKKKHCMLAGPSVLPYLNVKLLCAEIRTDPVLALYSHQLTDHSEHSHFSDGNTEVQRACIMELGLEPKQSDSRCQVLSHLPSHGEF